MNEIEIINEAIETFGIDAQLDMCIEEMSELIKEICKKKRGKNNKVKIIEEMADVYIMLEQLKLICNINQKDIELVAKIKVKRLNERLEKINHGI